MAAERQIRGLFYGHSGHPTGHAPSVTTPEQREEIARRYTEDGESAISIAASMGLIASTVRQYTPTRQPGGTKRKKRD